MLVDSIFQKPQDSNPLQQCSKGTEKPIVLAISPSADVVGGDDRLSRPSEQAGQVKPLVARCLHVVAELDHHYVRHRFAVLQQW